MHWIVGECALDFIGDVEVAFDVRFVFTCVDWPLHEDVVAKSVKHSWVFLQTIHHSHRYSLSEESEEEVSFDAVEDVAG